ncbi:hypothetical protein ACQ86B_28485 (plasmid) [Mycolicibacterium aichiense]|uniref:hypothetical protein n=1 Tax=Mycolicibacterium aichiense TaxID=1799 RepID=UPI003D67212A
MQASGVINVLRALHDDAWDPQAGLIRAFPGMDPGKELTEPRHHPIRESALGAYLDLAAGNCGRACAAIDGVIAAQYDTPGLIWHGTFRKAAEQPDPPGAGAIEWFHYDPNWRQFIGIIFALCLTEFPSAIDVDRSSRMMNALRLALEGEPVSRIAEWYTNPNLMHAWLEAWYGVRTGDDRYVRAGHQRASLVHKRLVEYGDVDEYNSPTYDGIDLFAAALWSKRPPHPDFERFGNDFLRIIGQRLSRLYHRELGVMCGPHIRAYGLDLRRYVSLIGLWLTLAGEPIAKVLPEVLDERTVHIHDLYFFPIFAKLSDVVMPTIDLALPFPRSLEQAFDEELSSSRLTAQVAIGAERGRVPDFAKDQYIAVTAHAQRGSDRTYWVGLALGHLTETIDGTIQSETAITGCFGTAYPEQGNDVAVLSSIQPSVDGQELSVGPIVLTFDALPVSVHSSEQANGVLTRVRFTGTKALFRLDVNLARHPQEQ